MIARPNSKAVDRKRRLALPHADLPVRDPRERAGDFEEAYGEWDSDTARAEAERCIQCPAAPCVKACPVGNDIPYALWLLEHGDVDGAASVFRATNTIPEICGRVCPQSELCEGACVYAKQGRPAVPIGRLEAFVADHGQRSPAERPSPSGHRAAVVGAGPAGLTVAEDLARLGHEVSVFDAWPAGGGILRYGIPTFKMAHRLVQDKLDWMTTRVSFEYGTVVGRDLTAEDLFDRGFETVFLGIGAGQPRVPSFPGADLAGVHQATPFLVRANVDEELRPADLSDPIAVGRRVAIVGGGDTAMDCVRTAIRLGADEVTCWYRRTEEEMPGNERDRALARQEGAAFEWLAQPVRLSAGPNGRVASMECVRMRLGEPDDSGRRSPVEIHGSEFLVPVDTVVLALGYLADRETVSAVAGLAADERSLITIDLATGATSRDGLFAGGDAVLGPALVVTAVEQGRKAAAAMHRHMTARGASAPAGRLS